MVPGPCPLSPENDRLEGSIAANSIGLQKKLKSVIKTDGPVLCEVIGLENQDYISSSHARNSNRRFVHRPIEDQAPFLDRELFLSEMIVKPIDQ